LEHADYFIRKSIHFNLEFFDNRTPTRDFRLDKVVQELGG
jgi:hypothetical protein